ncbi:MAG: hypothetical protein KF835_03600 [Xanthobacteraceae bacterium]|nr:hypothetical protein [Xanthobacteraceae bacterium]
MEAILQCGGGVGQPGYDVAASVRNREHLSLLSSAALSLSLSFVEQKQRGVKNFFSEIPVDCNVDLVIARRLET